MAILNIRRRNFLRNLGAGTAFLAALPHVSLAQTQHQRGGGSAANPDFHPDLEIELSAGPGEKALLPGSLTRLWRFSGRALKGNPAAFQMLPGDLLPVIRVRNRQKIRIHFLEHEDMGMLRNYLVQA